MKLTILATPTSAVGHVNACTGTLAPLLRRGHRIIFVIDEAFEGKLSALGFQEHIIRVEKPAECQNPGELIAKLLWDSKVLGPYTPWEKQENYLKLFDSDETEGEIRLFDSAIKEAIEKYKPNLIYSDCSLMLGAIYYSGVSWIRNISTTPINYLVQYDVPPSGSGLSFDGDRCEWPKWNELRKNMLISKKYGDILERLGYARFPNDELILETQLFTVYGYPEELNYPAIRDKSGWFNLEIFNKNEVKKVVELEKLIPVEFLSNTLDGRYSGKLIYVSMGSMGSVDLVLMKRLVDVLGKTNHKYIVSKGPRHSEYDLPSNMYGDRYLPQTSILPHVDLVITHGGNNTVTEVFAEGKPMIVLPLFGDQFDNAQRLVETGYGQRMDTYKFTDEQLINGIDKLLNDSELNQKLKKASNRIVSLNKHEELASKIEEFFIKN